MLIDDCVLDPCLNGATCINLQVGYLCECPPGWNGTNCEVNIDECASDPCLNGGTCTEGLDLFHCTCASGWTGTRCDSGMTIHKMSVKFWKTV